MRLLAVAVEIAAAAFDPSSTIEMLEQSLIADLDAVLGFGYVNH
jgi:hypothetical protein